MKILAFNLGALKFAGKELDPNLQASVNRCKIPAGRLKLGKKLGQGHFGAVYKGQLLTQDGVLKTVAVKSLKGS